MINRIIDSFLELPGDLLDAWLPVVIYLAVLGFGLKFLNWLCRNHDLTND